MYCRYCGKIIPDDAEFCAYCGGNLGSDSTAESSGDSSQNSNYKQETSSSKGMEDRLAHLNKYEYRDIYSAFVKVDERISKREWEDAVMQVRNALEALTLHLLKEYESQEDINFYLKSNGLMSGAGTYIIILQEASIIDQESASNLSYLNRESRTAHHNSGQSHEYTEAEAKTLYSKLLTESRKFTSVYLNNITQEKKRNINHLFWGETGQNNNYGYDSNQYGSDYKEDYSSDHFTLDDFLDFFEGMIGTIVGVAGIIFFVVVFF